MPIYEFHCNKCNKPFEYLILNTKDKPHCPDCGTRDIKKQYSVFGLTGSPAQSCSTCTSSNCSTCG